MFPLSILMGWMSIVAFVSILSLYANWATHLSGWAASRAEARQVEAETAEVDISANNAKIDVPTGRSSA